MFYEKKIAHSIARFSCYSTDFLFSPCSTPTVQHSTRCCIKPHTCHYLLTTDKLQNLSCCQVEFLFY